MNFFDQEHAGNTQYLIVATANIFIPHKNMAVINHSFLPQIMIFLEN